MRTGQRARAAVAGAVAASVVTGGVLLGGGTAAADPAPIVVGSCGDSISGAPGQPITLSGSALVPLITNALPSGPFGSANPLAGLVSGIVSPLQIPLGVVPSASTTIPGSQIATSTTTALQGTLLGGASATPIAAAVTSGCTVLVTVVNNAGTAVQGATGAVGGALTSATAALPQLPAPGGAPAPAVGGGSAATPQGGGSPQAGGAPQGGSPAAAGTAPAASPTYTGSVDRAQMGDLLSQVTTGTATQYNFGRVPLYSYAGTPYAVAGGAGRGLSPSALYGSAVPGYSPQFGILGSKGAAGPADGVARASQVEALGAASTPGTIGIVTLLAVLLLSGTAATLVRTVVLRRSGRCLTVASTPPGQHAARPSPVTDDFPGHGAVG
jgi:hypothetical protein